MKKIIGLGKTADNLNGRRRIVNEDFEILQEHYVRGVELPYAGFSPCVVAGCKLSGNKGNYTIGAGLIYINDKLIYFEGASGYDIKSDSCIVEDTSVLIAPRMFDAINEEREGAVHFKAKLVDAAPTQGQSIKLTETGFQRVYQNLLGDSIYSYLFSRISRDIVPLGTVSMWGGVVDNTVFDTTGKGIGALAGWALCNGQNNTPDLRGRFIAGYDAEQAAYNAIGKSGGAETVRLVTDNLPSHRHTKEPAAGNAGLLKRSSVGQNVTLVNTDTIDSGIEPDIRSSPVQDEIVGGNQPHENRPPFYVLAYIQKISAGAINSTGTGGTGGGGGTNNCNLVSRQKIGVFKPSNHDLQVRIYAGTWWVVQVTATSPDNFIPRGSNLILNADLVQPVGTLPLQTCLSSEVTGLNGLIQPSTFPLTIDGYTRKVSNDGTVYFEENTGGGGTGGGTVGEEVITFNFELS
jgi:microcystin-dependent protein